MTITGQSSLSTPDNDKEDLRGAPGDLYKPVRPLILRRWSGSALTVLLVAGLAGLLALRHQEQKLGGSRHITLNRAISWMSSGLTHSAGLPWPTKRFEILQPLENYMPTAIATSIEPYWVLVNRLLCIFQPYDDLRQGTKKKKVTCDEGHEGEVRV